MRAFYLESDTISFGRAQESEFLTKIVMIRQVLEIIHLMDFLSSDFHGNRMCQNSMFFKFYFK